MTRAVFLDRDGVLNRTIIRKGESCPPAGLQELEILPGVDRACHHLRAADFKLIVVTNQPDVARGTMRKEVVEQINQALCVQLPLDDIRICYHDDVHNCLCRKPEPGLLLQAAKDWGIELESSFMIGDRWKDIEAGRRAGCRTILIRDTDLGSVFPTPDLRVKSLLQGTDWILRLNSMTPRRT